MPTFKQHSYLIPVPKKGEKPKIHRIKSAPFHRGHELLGLVNQGGKIKLHALVDVDLPEDYEEILVVGTNNQVDEDLVERIQKIGSLILNDGQYGYHYYHVSKPEFSGLAPSGESMIKISLTLDETKGDAAMLEDGIYRRAQGLKAYGFEFEPDVESMTLTFQKPEVRTTAVFSDLMAFIYSMPVAHGIKVDEQRR